MEGSRIRCSSCTGARRLLTTVALKTEAAWLLVAQIGRKDESLAVGESTGISLSKGQAIHGIDGRKGVLKRGGHYYQE